MTPQRAIDDYEEYRRRGGRFDLHVWWLRYREDYEDEES